MPVIYALGFDRLNSQYIGSTNGKLSKRLREHRCLLRAGKHQCMALQEMYRFFGDTLTIQSVEELPQSATLEERRQAELKWMDRLAVCTPSRLLNEHRISMSPPDGAPAKAAAARVANGYKPSAETNLKRRLAQLGKPKGHGAKISATKRAKAMR